MYRITYPLMYRRHKEYGSVDAREICSLEPADPSETDGMPGFWKVLFRTSPFEPDSVLYLDRNSIIEIVGEKRYAVLDGRVTEYDDGVAYGYGAFARLARILAEESVMKALEAL